MRVLVTGGAGYILKKTNSSLSGPCSGTKPPVACTVLQRSRAGHRNIRTLIRLWVPLGPGCSPHPGSYPKHI